MRTRSLSQICFFWIVILAPIVSLIGWETYKECIFSINCSGHLKLAADSSTVDLASKELAYAIKYLDDNKITEGYTSVLWNTPYNDVGFWYQNLKSCQEELSKITSTTAQLEKTNVLMKLRETLLDHGQEGDYVTLPSGVSLFPYNSFYFLARLFSLAIAILGILFFVIFSEKF